MPPPDRAGRRQRQTSEANTMQTRDERFELLADRVAWLEARHRKLLGVLAAGALLALTLATMAFGSQDPAGAREGVAPDILKVRRLEIVSADGATKAELWVREDDGLPEFRMLDSQGRQRVRMGVFKQDQPALFVVDDDGQNRVSLVCNDVGEPFVILSMNGGKPAAQLSVSARDAPSLIFTHKSGAMNAGIGQNPDGTPWILPKPKGSDEHK